MYNGKCGKQIAPYGCAANCSPLTIDIFTNIYFPTPLYTKAAAYAAAFVFVGLFSAYLLFVKLLFFSGGAVGYRLVICSLELDGQCGEGADYREWDDSGRKN